MTEHGMYRLLLQSPPDTSAYPASVGSNPGQLLTTVDFADELTTATLYHSPDHGIPLSPMVLTLALDLGTPTMAMPPTRDLLAMTPASGHSSRRPAVVPPRDSALIRHGLVVGPVDHLASGAHLGVRLVRVRVVEVLRQVLVKDLVQGREERTMGLEPMRPMIEHDTTPNGIHGLART
jgi:hypothetical protein